MSQQIKGNIDATPSKRVFLPIINDYNLNTAICELVDNSIDAWRFSENKNFLKIEIIIDIDQQTIVILDNACGVKEKELKKLISPGETSQGLKDSIGFFGVGSKRAVVALAQDIKISSRYEDGKTFLIKYDDEWLRTDDWNIPYTSVEEDIQPNTTKVELSKLRREMIEKSDVENLREHLAATYVNFIKDDNIRIYLNEENVRGKSFDQWAFPDGYAPKTTIRELPFKSGENVLLRITSGLTYEKGAVGGDFGVFLYCNKRLIAKALKAAEVGFISGLVGIPHADMSLARIIVEISGASELMPWTSNKTAVFYNHQTFSLIKEDLIKIVKNCVSWSKSLKKDFKLKVEPFKTGNIIEEKLSLMEPIKPRKLLTPPKIKESFKDRVLTFNRSVGILKPWARGLYESLIAEELIHKQKNLSQKNRISLIILDSVVEIGCKEFLVRELPGGISEKDLKAVFAKGRLGLHREVEKYILTDRDVWGRLDYYYHIRNKLIHERASAEVSDEDIQIFREDVKDFLSAAFGIQFPD